MKFLFFTDTHIRGNNPKSRKDNFVETLKNKFIELVEVTKSEKIDAVLFGGDLFERPDVSISVVKEFLSIIKRFPLPIYSVIGNHDVFGQNPEVVGKTMLGILEETGIIEFLSKEPKLFAGEGKTVQITGGHYFYGVDDENKDSYILNEKSADFAIHIVHGFLLDRPFIKGIHHTLIDEICNKTMADITIAGHYHSGFGIKKYDKKYFINPGAIARVSNSISEIDRMPSYLVIEINDDISIELRQLKCAKKGEEVLDKEKLQEEYKKMNLINEFANQITSYGNFETLKLEKLINEIATIENIPEDIKKEALDRLTKAQELISLEEVID
ncbi:metallophosphoesterase family protein [Caloramator mitchellensis]|nr:metallophosphoesterase [Caloramator mitchellensis]